VTDDWDDPVEISPGNMRFSVDAIRALRKASGRTMSELLGDDDDEAAKFQAMSFAELYRRSAREGHVPDAGELWERAGRVELVFVNAERPDPTRGERSRTSPSSADIGA
jgi:hypothetical protein